ncbi:MAG: hypothetical protein IMZ53_02920 [Thermoplasmata archaeon]|nr:hypothetical protein [Thermoplasmata archaeon]
MSEYNISDELHGMVPGPAPSAVVQVIYRTEKGIMLCYGTSADTVLEAEAANTYAPGCIYIKCVSTGTSIMYYNTGAEDAVAAFTAFS